MSSWMIETTETLAKLSPSILTFSNEKIRSVKKGAMWRKRETHHRCRRSRRNGNESRGLSAIVGYRSGEHPGSDPLEAPSVHVRIATWMERTAIALFNMVHVYRSALLRRGSDATRTRDASSSASRRVRSVPHIRTRVSYALVTQYRSIWRRSIRRKFRSSDLASFHLRAFLLFSSNQ